MVYYLYACVNGATGNTVNKYTMAGALLWASKVIVSDAEYQVATGICTDPDENSYVCGKFTDGATVYHAAKFTAAGALAWKTVVTDMPNEVAGIAVLPSGNVIVATERWDAAGVYSTLSLLAAATGIAIWNYDSGADDVPTHVAADSDGNILYTSDTYLTMLDSSHTELWQVAHGIGGAGPWSLVVGDGIVFADGHKFSLVDGAEITAGDWPFALPVVATDDAENVYLASYSAGYDGLGCVVADLSTPLWLTVWAEADGPSAAQAFAVCRANRVFLCHRDTVGADGGHIHAYDATTGVEITDGWPIITGGYTDFIAAGPGLIGAYPAEWGAMLPPPSIYVGDVLYE